jgi:hypothetical protein
MDDTKYIGMDVHKETISIAVLNSSGKLVMETIIETKASTLLQFVQGLRGSLHVTLEEGTWAAWLYDLLKPHVTKVLVCDPRKNALLKVGNKSDRIVAIKVLPAHLADRTELRERFEREARTESTVCVAAPPRSSFRLPNTRVSGHSLHRGPPPSDSSDGRFPLLRDLTCDTLAAGRTIFCRSSASGKAYVTAE